jgi:hypothetical protein
MMGRKQAATGAPMIPRVKIGSDRDLGPLGTGVRLGNRDPDLFHERLLFERPETLERIGDEAAGRDRAR